MTASRVSDMQQTDRQAFWLWAVILTAILFCAEHFSPFTSVIPEDWSPEYLISGLDGTIWRRVAYLSLAGIGLWFLYGARRRRMGWHKPLTASVVALLTWSALSILWSDEPLTAARRFLVLALLLLAAFGFVRRWPQGILPFIVVCGTVHLTVGVVAEIVHNTFAPFSSSYRFAGTLHWNEQGLCCAILAHAALAGGRTAPRCRWLFRLVFAYALGCLVLTKSRTSFIGFVFGLAVYLCLVLPKRSKLLIAHVTTLIVLLTVLLGGQALWRSAYEALSRGGEGEETLSGRSPLWDECFTYVRRHPIEGYGFQTFWTAKRIGAFSDELHWGVAAAHSAYVESLLMGGLISLVLHTTVVVIAAWRSVAVYRRHRAPEFAFGACVFAMYLVIGALESVLIIGVSPVSFYVALCLLLVCVSNDSTEQQAATQARSLGLVTADSPALPQMIQPRARLAASGVSVDGGR